jgi:hypothetical protein
MIYNFGPQAALADIRLRKVALQKFLIYSRTRGRENCSIFVLDSYIPIMPCIFLSIPEGVLVMTVIIDGVDVALAGVVKRSSYSREPWNCPADTRIRALKGS